VDSSISTARELFDRVSSENPPNEQESSVGSLLNKVIEEQDQKSADYIMKSIDLLIRLNSTAKEYLDDQEMRLVLDAALTSIRPNMTHHDAVRIYRDVQTSIFKIRDQLIPFINNSKAGKETTE